MNHSPFRCIVYLVIGIYLGLRLPQYAPNLITHTFLLKESTLDIDRHHDVPGETTVAEFMVEKVKVFCGILVDKEHHKTIAKAVKETWARRCSRYQFFSTIDDYSLPSIKISEGEYNSTVTEWEIASGAIKYIYDNEIDNYDWFLLAKENCYVVFENLRCFPNKPIAFGEKVKKSEAQKFFALDLGSSVVLSKAAVKSIVDLGLNSEGGCASFNEDSAIYAFQRCLSRSGVTLEKGIDSEHKCRFVPTNPLYFFEVKDISETAVSFHAYGRRAHHTLEYLIYHLSPFGATSAKKKL